MPIISAKRQITLPIQQCKELGLQPGDEYISFIVDGRITIIKKVATAAKGILQYIKGDVSISDEESLQDGRDSGQIT